MNKTFEPFYMPMTINGIGVLGYCRHMNARHVLVGTFPDIAPEDIDRLMSADAELEEQPDGTYKIIPGLKENK